MNHGYQLLAVGTAALAFLAAIYRYTPWQLLLSIGVFMAIIYTFACWFILRDIYKLAFRVREIEIDVNDRCGEDLLIWENLAGGAKTGFWWGLTPFPREELKSTPKPIRTRKGEPINPTPLQSN